MNIIEGLLPIHDKYKDEGMGPMHEAIVEKFEETKARVNETYGHVFVDTFKVKHFNFFSVQEPTLNRLLLKELNH